MDGAKSRFGGKFGDDQVEDVKAVLRLLPVFITFIFYFSVFSQVRLCHHEIITVIHDIYICVFRRREEDHKQDVNC